MSNSVQPHRPQPTRLPCPWDSPGKNTGVGCHLLLQCMKVKSESEVTQSCPTLCDPIDSSQPGSPIPGILQARTLEWLPFPFPMHESEKSKSSRSVVSDSSRPHGLQPTRLLRPWDFPGKSTGVGCHCLQALKGGPRVGSYSVDQRISHLNEHPGGVLLCRSVYQAFDGPASLLFSCRCWHVGRERGYGDGPSHYA